MTHVTKVYNTHGDLGHNFIWLNIAKIPLQFVPQYFLRVRS